MFASTTFRWTFVTWRFFSLIASSSVLLTLMCLILGLICRLNFGKGLLRYCESNVIEESTFLMLRSRLKCSVAAQDPIPDERVPESFIGGKNEDLEKVNFPSHEEVFSVTFGPGDVPPPSQVFNDRQRGSRFHNQSANLFGAHGPSLHSSPSSGTSRPGQDGAHSTHSSEHTMNTTLSRNNSHSSQSSSASRSERWVIE